MISRSRISFDSVLNPDQQQISCNLAGEAVILNLRDGIYYGLNPVAALIWDLLQEGQAVGAIHDHLVASYPDVEPEHLTEDLLTFLEEMMDAELLAFSPQATE